MKYYLLALKKYAVFEGRASRREYWMFFLFNAIFMILAVILDAVLQTTIRTNGVSLSLFTTGYSLAILIPTISIAVRRFHDVGKEGLPIILIVYVYAFIFYPITRAVMGKWIVLDIIAGIFNIFFIVSGIYIILVLLSPGDTEDNRFGQSPLKAQQVKNASEPGESEIAQDQQLCRTYKNN